MLKRNITGYTYDGSSVRRMLRADDFWKYSLDKDEVEQVTEDISRQFIESDGATKNIRSSMVGDSRIFTTGSLYDALTVRRTNDIICSIFRFPSFTRDEEVKQLVKIVEGEYKSSEMMIFRSDISKFFESINFENVINDLYYNDHISNQTYKHLCNICDHVKSQGVSGLPRGLSISSTICEFVLKDFDDVIRRMPGVLYYTRYVDDFVLISSNKIKSLVKLVSNKLPEPLSLNPKKTSYNHFNKGGQFEYLGYSIKLDRSKQITVSKKKINRVKTRIIKSFCCFLRDNDFDLLMMRMKFLTGNTLLRMAGRTEMIKVGFRYQYSLCTVESLQSVLVGLDNFKNGVINSKQYRLSINLKRRLTQVQKDEIIRTTFIAGYENKITNKLKRTEVSKIKAAWKYE